MCAHALAHNAIKAKEHLKLFIRISSRISSAANKTDFMKLALADMGHVMQVSRTYIFSVENNLWSNTYEWVAEGIQGHKNELQNISFDMDKDKGGMLHTLSCGKPYIIHNVNTVSDKFTRTIMKQQGVYSAIVVPLFAKGEIIGMLGFDQCTHLRTWSAEDINAMIILGSLINHAKVFFNTQNILQKKKNQVQALFDACPFPIYISSMEDYSILFYNKTIDDLFDMSDVSNKKCYEVFQNFDSPCPFCTNAFLQKGDVPYVWHHHNPVAEKDYKIIDRCMDWENHSNARLSVALDITDSLRLQREQVLEREANLAKGRFLANMSHELRTPLNGIIGMNHLASVANDDAKVQDYLDKMHLSSRNLLGIVNDILDFSKLENKKVTLENRPFSFTDILFETQAILQGEIDHKGLHLHCYVDKNVPLLLNGDSLRLSQILLNLTNNAIKFTASGSISLEIYAKNHNELVQYVELWVKDTGIGISEENLQKLFKEFSQAETSTTRRYGGTGLGLSIVQRLVGLMGGTVRVESVLGKGTSFVCSIPFGKVVDNSDSTLAKENVAEQKVEDISGLRILLVEDNEINTLIATEVLEQYGCHVDSAEDGAIALRMLENTQYDLVIMDIQMPNMDGLEASQHIRSQEKYNTLPIIAMSAHALVQDHEKSRQAGMQAHVIKPFVPEQLRKVIYQYTHKPFVFEAEECAKKL